MDLKAWNYRLWRICKYLRGINKSIWRGGGGRGEVPGRLQRRAAGVASSGNCNIYYVSSHPCKIHFYHSSHLLCHCLTTIVCLSHILNALYKSRLCPSCKTNQLARWRDAQLRLLFHNVHAQFIPVKENAQTYSKSKGAKRICWKNYCKKFKGTVSRDYAMFFLNNCIKLKYFCKLYEQLHAPCAYRAE